MELGIQEKIGCNDLAELILDDWGHAKQKQRAFDISMWSDASIDNSPGMWCVCSNWFL